MKPAPQADIVHDRFHLLKDLKKAVDKGSKSGKSSIDQRGNRHD
jgi:hypothetical protein